MFAIYLVFTVVLKVSTSYHPLSNEFIKEINDLQTTWTAGRNFHSNMSISNIHKLIGVLPNYKSSEVSKIFSIRMLTNLPESFDAREKWPYCASVKEIRDQGSCGSCWAIAAVEAMSDRICIHSKGKKQISVSVQDLLTCCWNCGLGCDGGWILPAWQYWWKHGIVSGGMFNTTTGCKAYTVKSCEHHMEGEREICENIEGTPQCNYKCDLKSDLHYESDLSFGRKPYYIYGAQGIQKEILENGPVEAVLNIYEDFLSYKKGVYQHVRGQFLGGHAVKILGWGVENNQSYWLIANSWNSDWGDKGYFKILRGVNHLGIEDYVITSLPKL